MLRIFTLANSTVKELDPLQFDPTKFGKKRFNGKPHDKSSENVVFVNCYKPDEQELERFSSWVGYKHTELHALLTEQIRPRLEEEDDCLWVIYRAPFYEEVDEITTAPMGVFIRGNVIFSLCNYKIKSMGQIIKDLEQQKKAYMFKKHPGNFLFYFLDKINDEYLMIMNKIADSSELIKERSEALSKKNIERIDSLNTTLIYFNRAFLGNAEVITLLKKGDFSALNKFNKSYLNDLYFDALQLLDTEKIQRDVITSIFHFQNALTSYKLNGFLKRLTSLALVIAIPTLITSAWGMNFDHIPFQNNPYGFYILILIMLLTLIPVYFMFKRFDRA